MLEDDIPRLLVLAKNMRACAVINDPQERADARRTAGTRPVSSGARWRSARRVPRGGKPSSSAGDTLRDELLLAGGTEVGRNVCAQSKRYAVDWSPGYDPASMPGLSKPLPARM